MSLPSSLRLKQKSNQVEKLPSSLRIKEKPIEFKGESEEETERNVERSQARTLSRIGETAAGLPGDLVSFFAGLFGKEQNLLPTSQGLKEKTQKASLGYLAPKNEAERISDELVSDITSMALPGQGKYNFIRNIGIPVVGNLIKEGVKYKSGKEKSQAYSKVGTMIALDLISRRKGGVKSYMSDLFNKAEKAIPEGLSIDASNLEKSLNNLQSELSKGGKRPTTSKSLEKIAEIKNEIKNGKIDAKRLAAYRPSINEAVDELGGFNLEVPKKLRPQTIKNLHSVKNEVIKTLEEYGEKFNPEYLKYSQEANEAYAAYSKSNKIANFLQSKISYQPKSAAVQSLFSLAPKLALGAVTYISPASAIGGGAAMSAYQGYKVLDRVTRSPVLRKYYLNVIKEAGAGNIPSATKNLKALDNLILKEEEK